MKTKSILIRGAIVATAATVIFTAIMGFAHTKAGRPLLAKLGGLMGKKEFCPLGYDRQATPEDRDRARKNAAAQHAGAPAASERSALAFELEQTTHEQIGAWALRHGGECHAMKASSFETECVGPFFNSDTTTLWLAFDGKDRLVSARGVETFRKSDAAWAFYEDVRKQLRAQAGARAIEDGVKHSKELQPLLAQTSIVTSFSNYSASARLGNMGPNGFVLTHDFESF